MKKIIIVITAIAVCSVSAHAQWGKNLKNIGKTVGNIASQVAGELTADVAANQIANNIVYWMDSNNPVAADDDPYTQRLANIVSAKFLIVDGAALNYKVFLSPEINILACANGCIRIYSGMMDVLTDDEIAAIAATQIGHIMNKDARNSLMQVVTGENAENATVAQLEKMLSVTGEALGSIVNELIQIPYTDAQNRAADTYAVNLLTKNGIDSKALVTALEKFAAMEANDQSAANKYIRVNANNAERAAIVGAM